MLKTRLKDLSLTRHRVEAFAKVKVFLNSIERNSQDTKNANHLGLTHFQNFLDQKYPTQTQSQTQIQSQSQTLTTIVTVETILQLLAKNEINVYALLDGFVSFLMTLKLSVNSIILNLTAVKSYLG
jgi:hypothetical protein